MDKGTTADGTGFLEQMESGIFINTSGTEEVEERKREHQAWPIGVAGK